MGKEATGNGGREGEKEKGGVANRAGKEARTGEPLTPGTQSRQRWVWERAGPGVFQVR